MTLVTILKRIGITIIFILSAILISLTIYTFTLHTRGVVVADSIYKTLEIIVLLWGIFLFPTIILKEIDE